MNYYYIIICMHTYVLWDLGMTIVSKDHRSMTATYNFSVE